MKKLLIPIMLLSLNCAGQDTIKLQSDFARECLKAHVQLPKYKKVIEKRDSVIAEMERIDYARVQELDTCNTLNESLQDLNDKLIGDNVKAIHDAKWKAIWRKTSILFGSLLIAENGVLYLMYKP